MFSELATYAWNELNTKYEKEVEYNWYKIDQYHLYMLTDDIESILRDLVQDWCDDHDIDTDEFYDNYDLMDIWEFDPEIPDGVNESYADNKCEYSAQTNGAILEGLQGMINLMRNYDDYRQKALKEITDFYTKLGIKVISATPSNDNDGFSIKLDRPSVMQYLTENGCKYDIFDENEPIGEYVCDDLEELTIGKWKDCGKILEMLFSTLWAVGERYNVGQQTVYKPEGDLYITMQQENAIDIEYVPGIYDIMDDVLHALRNSVSDENILNSRKFAKN